MFSYSRTCRGLVLSGTALRKARSRVPLVTKCVLEGLAVKTGEKIWMTMVRPTLEYAMEICGGGNWPQAEQIQEVVGRTLLGLSSKAAGEVARGELGWISMKARRDLKMLKFWGPAEYGQVTAG